MASRPTPIKLEDFEELFFKAWADARSDIVDSVYQSRIQLAKIALRAHAGKSNKEIAAELNAERKSVSARRRDVAWRRTSCINHVGASNKLHRYTDAQKLRLLRLLVASPPPGCRKWTEPLLQRAYMCQYGEKLSLDWIGRTRRDHHHGRRRVFAVLPDDDTAGSDLIYPPP